MPSYAGCKNVFTAVKSRLSDDWTLPEIVRNVRRLDNDVTRCVNETIFAASQETMNRQFGDLGQRMTASETQSKSDTAERSRERQARIAMFVAAGLGFASSLALFIIQLIAK